jgi:hypothetical protein
LCFSNRLNLCYCHKFPMKHLLLLIIINGCYLLPMFIHWKLECDNIVCIEIDGF